MRTSWLDVLSPVEFLPRRSAVRAVVFDKALETKERRRQQIAAAHAAWYRRNAERERAKRRARYLANKEREKELNRAWRQKNRGHQRIISKLWARKRRAKLKAMGLTSRGTQKAVVNPSHFKKGWRDAVRA